MGHTALQADQWDLHLPDCILVAFYRCRLESRMYRSLFRLSTDEVGSVGGIERIVSIAPPIVMLLGEQIYRACSLVASDSPAASPGNYFSKEPISGWQGTIQR